MWFIRLSFPAWCLSGFLLDVYGGWHVGGWGSLRRHVTAKESYWVWRSCWMQDTLPRSSFLILKTLLGRPFGVLIMVLAIQLVNICLNLENDSPKEKQINFTVLVVWYFPPKNLWKTSVHPDRSTKWFHQRQTWQTTKLNWVTHRSLANHQSKCPLSQQLLMEYTSFWRNGVLCG